MEPEKAKRAIIITIITAIILLAVCTVLLFSDQIFGKGQGEEPPVEPTTSEEPVETSPSPAATSEPVPGPDVLKGTSDSLQYPKESSYMDRFVSMVTQSKTTDHVYMLYKPEKLVNSFDVMLTLDNNTPVTAVAQENGFTLVLLKDGVAGWVASHDLAEH